MQETADSRPLEVDDALLDALAGIALTAGRVVLGRPGRGEAERDAKSHARDVILGALAEIAPGVPVLAPGPDGRIPSFEGAAPSQYFLVDPADGADEQSADGSAAGEVTIDIGLVRDGAPVAGVVYAPAFERLWSARHGAATRARVPAGVGAGPNLPIGVRPAPESGLAAFTSRASRPGDVEAFLGGRSITEVRIAGASLKLCLLAEGSGDLYPQLARSWAWSTAAGDAVLRAAGGRTVTLDGAALSYPSPRGDRAAGLANPPFVALGSLGLRELAARPKAGQTPELAATHRNQT